MGQKLFTSGEFAKFCNTTKDTLFHYDDINLLKPAKIAVVLKYKGLLQMR